MKHSELKQIIKEEIRNVLGDDDVDNKISQRLRNMAGLEQLMKKISYRFKPK